MLWLPWKQTTRYFLLEFGFVVLCATDYSGVNFVMGSVYDDFDIHFLFSLSLFVLNIFIAKF
jgi:hypothetical protein